MTFTASQPRWKVGLLFAGTLLGFIVFLLLSGIFGGDFGVITNIKAWIGVLIMPPLLIACLVKLIEPKDRIALTAQGILIRDWSDTKIAWEDVAHVRLDHFSYGGNSAEYIAIKLVDPNKYSGKFLHSLSWSPRYFGNCDIAFGPGFLDKSGPEIFAAIERFRAVHSRYGAPRTVVPPVSQPRPIKHGFGRKGQLP